MIRGVNISVSATNLLENSYQQYYGAYLNYKIGTFSEMDSLTLTELAQGCPATMGASVFQAAALYNVVYQVAEVFETTCATPQSREMQVQEENTINSKITESDYKLYPVPNDGSFYMEGNFATGDELSILSADGKTVFNMKIYRSVNQIVINSNLNSGIYFVLVHSKDGVEQFKNKIVVIK